MVTALLSDALFQAHDTGTGHPERAERLRAVEWRLEQGLLRGALLLLGAEREVSPEEIEAVHAPAYLEFVQRTLALSAESGQSIVLDEGDTRVSPGSGASMLRAAGAGLDLADRMIAGEITNGFALIRPPGHHAERDRAMGFCILNNIALLARYLQSRHALRRIAIVDFDVHHGNGTQNAFYCDPEVLYISLHQYPHFPGTGAAGERGEGAGEGTTLNLPMAAGSGPAEYLAALDRQILPALRSFAPEVLLISAGFDAHRADPLGDIRLEAETYERMTRELCELAAGLGHNRVLSLLEGGYDLDALARSVEAHLRALLEVTA